MVLNMPGARQIARYHSHTFMDKEKSCPLQSADMLAYLSAKRLKGFRTQGTDVMRKDLEALVGCRLPHQRDSIHYWDADRLQQQMATIMGKGKGS
jgi:hypothetical protein